MTRTEILQEAEKAINGSREQDYGKAESNLGMIADLWSTRCFHIFDDG